MSLTGRPPLTFELFPEVATFELRSNDLVDAQAMPLAQVAEGEGLNGSNRSPHLVWSGFPPETQGFALTVHDPDAPTGSGFWHWLVCDIPVDVHELASGCGTGEEGLLPEGAFHVRNDAGQLSYFGAAPPPGPEHRYVHTVHALDVTSLGLDDSVSPAIVGFNLRFHAIARAQIVVTFGT